MSVLVDERNDEALRKALSEITTQHIRKQAHEQIRLIEVLREKYGHAISLVQEAIPGQPETGQFTCYQYAFNLVDAPPEVIRIASDHQKIYPSSVFVQFLIDHVLDELSAPKDGCVIVYSDGQEIKHAGKMRGQMVVSKWGTAHLWQHRIYEVPITYGSSVRFFEAIQAERSIQAFLRYAEIELGQGQVG
jgi:hypothetical protein